jgi:hypothetical protein
MPSVARRPSLGVADAEHDRPTAVHSAGIGHWVDGKEEAADSRPPSPRSAMSPMISFEDDPLGLRPGEQRPHAAEAKRYPTVHVPRARRCIRGDMGEHGGIASAAWIPPGKIDEVIARLTRVPSLG